MDAMDSTIATIAGPSVRRDLGGGASTLQWISAGYTLAFAVLLIAGARLGDIFGRRRVFLLGLAGFTIFSAACAAAPWMPMLIASRALQGASGALMIPQGFGFLKQVFPDQAEFNKAMGFVGPATGLPLLAAPILAGALIDANLWHVGWRLVFLINVPIGVIALALAIPTLPDSPKRSGLTLDVGGVWLVGLALVAIIYPLIQGRADGWPLWSFALLAAGALLLFVFLRHERGHRGSALIEPTLLSNRTYLSGIAVILLFFGAFAGLLLSVSFYGQLGEGWSPIHAGLTLTPMVIGIILGMTVSFALVDRLGRHLLHIGILLIAAGSAGIALTLTGAHSASTWDLSLASCSPVSVPARASPSSSGSSSTASRWTRSDPRPVSLRRPNSFRPRSASPSSGRSSSLRSTTTSRQMHCRSPHGRVSPRSPARSCSSSGCPCTPATSRNFSSRTTRRRRQCQLARPDTAQTDSDQHHRDGHRVTAGPR